MISLSILDQVPISGKDSPETALKNCIELAQMADKLGYKRYWIAEHHNTNYFANSSPEVLMSTIASLTSKIKVGSGGILLQHYSSYKVAENLKLLSTLYPNRIDAGFGRSAGGDKLSSQALGGNNEPYDTKIQHTYKYLTTRNDKLFVSPVSEQYPEMWILGSGEKSGEIAAKKGLSFAFGHFLTPDDDGIVVKKYLDNFVPSDIQSNPNVALCINVICAETEEKCSDIEKSMELMTILLKRGNNPTGMPSPELAQKIKYTVEEQRYLAENRKKIFIGTPSKIRKNIMKLSKKYNAKEIIILTITYNHIDRLNSYRLIIEEINKHRV